MATRKELEERKFKKTKTTNMKNDIIKDFELLAFKSNASSSEPRWIWWNGVFVCSDGKAYVVFEDTEYWCTSRKFNIFEFLQKSDSERVSFLKNKKFKSKEGKIIQMVYTGQKFLKPTKGIYGYMYNHP